jgi:carbamate kinase
MLPKVEAAVSFAETSPGRKTIITSLEKAFNAIVGQAGTVVSLQGAEVLV